MVCFWNFTFCLNVSDIHRTPSRSHGFVALQTRHSQTFMPSLNTANKDKVMQIVLTAGEYVELVFILLIWKITFFCILYVTRFCTRWHGHQTKSALLHHRLVTLKLLCRHLMPPTKTKLCGLDLTSGKMMVNCFCLLSFITS